MLICSAREVAEERVSCAYLARRQTFFYLLLWRTAKERLAKLLRPLGNDLLGRCALKCKTKMPKPSYRNATTWSLIKKRVNETKKKCLGWYLRIDGSRMGLKSLHFPERTSLLRCKKGFGKLKTTDEVNENHDQRIIYQNEDIDASEEMDRCWNLSFHNSWSRKADARMSHTYAHWFCCFCHMQGQFN